MLEGSITLAALIATEKKKTYFSVIISALSKVMLTFLLLWILPECQGFGSYAKTPGAGFDPGLYSHKRID